MPKLSIKHSFTQVELKKNILVNKLLILWNYLLYYTQILPTAE